MRTAETILSEVKVFLNSEGNVEVEYSNVPPDDFVKEMNNKLPEYANTYPIYNFMKRLNVLTNSYYDNVNKLLS